MSKKREILKQVFSGKLSKEAISPPIFEMRYQPDGHFDYMIGGKVVTQQHFHAEQDRLHLSRFDIKFHIPFNDD